MLDNDLDDEELPEAELLDVILFEHVLELLLDRVGDVVRVVVVLGEAV